MALSTVYQAARPQHRTVRLGENAFQGTLALDWANGQAITLGAASLSSTVFDPNNDRVVMCSVGGASTVGGAWISVGVGSATATAGAGSMWISQAADPVPVHVPAGGVIAGLQGATAGTLSMVPALLATG